MSSLPLHAPFRIRARVLTALDAGGTRYLDDGVVDVDAAGRIVDVSPWPGPPPGTSRTGPDAVPMHGVADAGAVPEVAPVHDLRPWLLLPGLVDLHAHVPQLPNAGLGAGLDLLTWLERYTFPVEDAFDVQAAERIAPLAMAAFAAAGTTTVVAYATDDAEATDAVFRAAEAHGIRAIIGLVLMHRSTGTDGGCGPDANECAGLRSSADLCSRWNGRDAGRLRYAFTPRFAVCCSADVLRESARLAVEADAYWQTHLSEDRRELEAVRRAFPDARDYLDVYDRAGALGTRTILAHAIHLSAREIDRLAETGAGVAHCPASNLFLASGVMPLARYLETGVRVGLGSDVSGGPGVSLFEVMRAGAYSQRALHTLCGDMHPALDPLGWLELATLGGARVLGLQHAIGSIEAGKEADLIAIDPSVTRPLPHAGTADDPAETVSRLIFRTHPGMVRGAWVRGALLPS
jgi:guanine deaminase